MSIAILGIDITSILNSFGSHLYFSQGISTLTAECSRGQNPVWEAVTFMTDSQMLHTFVGQLRTGLNYCQFPYFLILAFTQFLLKRE